MRGTSYFTSEADTHVKGTDGLKDGETAIPSKPKLKKQKQRQPVGKEKPPNQTDTTQGDGTFILRQLIRQSEDIKKKL